MSTLRYGSDTLRMGRIQNYSLTAKMSEDGIDYISTRYDVDFVGVLSLDLGASPVTAARLLQERMMQPRQTFELYAGGTDTANRILTSNAPDIDGGPKCNNVSISQFAGSRTAIVSASFTIHKHDCPTAANGIPRILSNRWSMEHVLDQDYYTTRTITGELRANPYFTLNADDLRESCFRAIPKGMQMMSGRFRQSPDGLRLAYTIVAQEKYQLPPGEATDIKCEYNETTSNGALTMAEMFVDVAGPKTMTKAALLAIAAQTVLSRFKFPAAGQPAGNGEDIFKGGSIREIMHENRVSIVISAIRTQAVGIVAPLKTDRRYFGQPIPNAPKGKGGQIPIFGNVTDNRRGLRAVAAAWKTACAEGGSPIQSGTNINNFAGDGDIEGLDYQVEELPASSPDKVSPGQRQAPYNFYDIDVHHHHRSGIHAMPIAKKIPKTSGEPRDRTSVNVRLIQPTTYKVIYYRCERVGAKPEQPKWNVQVEGITVIGHSFHVSSPKLSADGVTPIYYATGKLTLQFHGGVDLANDDLPIGVDPTTTFEFLGDGTIGPGNFRDDILCDPGL